MAVFFVASYPIIVSLLWSCSAVFGEVERRLRRAPSMGISSFLPSYTVLVPFYGNDGTLGETLQSLSNLSPRPEEVVLIDDGSSDEGEADHSAILEGSNFRTLRLPRNVGKAAALNRGLRGIRSEVVVCLDADTISSTADWSGMLRQFALDPTLGAVTGKIWPARIRSLIHLLQAIDYLAVICFVKSAESVWGGIMTVSGAWVAYRRKAVEACKGWNLETSAEDIDISWRLQSRGWKVSYNGDWKAKVEMVPSWRKLWLQRRRWSSGLGRTLREQLRHVFRDEARHFPAAFTAVAGVTWIWLTFVVLCHAMVAMPLHISQAASDFIWFYNGCWPVYITAFSIQLTLAILTDRADWRRYPLLIVAVSLYPIYFWSVLFSSFICGFPKGFFRRDGGKWEPSIEPADVVAATGGAG